MRLFWRSGYEGVSIHELVVAIGIAPPSLYAAFGSKAGLYREALDRYATLPGALDGLGIAGSPAESAADILGRAVRAVTAPDGEPGCMISTGLVQAGAAHAAIAQDLAERRRAIQEAIARDLARWLPPGEASARAGHIAAVMIGLAVRAGDGADRAELEGVAAEVVAGIRAREAVDPVTAHTTR